MGCFFHIGHQVGVVIVGDDKNTLIWISGWIRLFQDVEQAVGFDRDHDALERYAALTKANGPASRPVSLTAAIQDQTISGTIIRATMLMILISGLTAGPAVSL